MNPKVDILGQAIALHDEVVVVVRGRLERGKITNMHEGARLDMLSVTSMDGVETVSVSSWQVCKTATS